MDFLMPPIIKNKGDPNENKPLTTNRRNSRSRKRIKLKEHFEQQINAAENSSQSLIGEDESYSLTTVKSKEKDSSYAENKSHNTGSIKPSYIESGIEIFSEDSDHLLDHYYIGPKRDKKGNVIFYSEKAEKFKTKMRLKDFYRILG